MKVEAEFYENPDGSLVCLFYVHKSVHRAGTLQQGAILAQTVDYAEEGVSGKTSTSLRVAPRSILERAARELLKTFAAGKRGTKDQGEK